MGGHDGFLADRYSEILLQKKKESTLLVTFSFDIFTILFVFFTYHYVNHMKFPEENCNKNGARQENEDICSGFSTL